MAKYELSREERDALAHVVMNHGDDLDTVEELLDNAGEGDFSVALLVEGSMED